MYYIFATCSPRVLQPTFPIKILDMPASARRCGPDFKPKVSSPLVSFVYTAADLLGYTSPDELQIDPALLEHQQAHFGIEEGEVMENDRASPKKETTLQGMNELRIRTSGYGYENAGEGASSRRRNTWTRIEDASTQHSSPAGEALSEALQSDVASQTNTADSKATSSLGLRSRTQTALPALSSQGIRAVELPLRGRKRSYSDGDVEGRVTKYRKRDYGGL